MKYDWNRYWRYVDMGHCWTWQGPVNQKGYPRYEWGRGRYAAAHWVAFILEVNNEASLEAIVDIIKFCKNLGLDLDHLCRERSCVFPDHLELVPHQINIARGEHGVLRTHCKNGHELTKENVYVRLHGSGAHQRVCRICRDAYMAEYRQRRKEVVG